MFDDILLSLCAVGLLIRDVVRMILVARHCGIVISDSKFGASSCISILLGMGIGCNFLGANIFKEDD